MNHDRNDALPFVHPIHIPPAPPPPTQRAKPDDTTPAGPVTLREWQRAMYAIAAAKGFHEGETPETVPFAEKIALIHSEVSEALEAFRDPAVMARGDLFLDDHGKPEGVGAELADVIIRVMDLAEAKGIDLEGAPMKIYVATSWKNELQPSVVEALRNAGHEVYDFRNPAPGNTGFGWRQCVPEPPPWSAETTRQVLAHQRAEEGYALDRDAMEWADAIVMLQPCGRSAAYELGWGVGAGKWTAALLADGQEPELMFKGADALCVTLDEVVAFLAAPPARKGRCVNCGVATCPACKGLERRAWLRPDAEPMLVVQPRDAILGPCPQCMEGSAQVWLQEYREHRNAGRCPTHHTALTLAWVDATKISARCPACEAEGHPWVFRATKGKKPFKAFAAIVGPVGPVETAGATPEAAGAADG